MKFRIALLLVLGIQPAQAATYCGPNVCYQWSDNQPALTNSHFGPIAFIGDSFYFTPTQFEARSVDGVGLHSGTNTDVHDATLQFDRVWVGTWDGNEAVLNNSNEIASILAYEEGDYEINYTDGEVQGYLYAAVRGLNNLAEATHIVTDTFDGVSGGLNVWAMSATLTPQATLTQLANNMTLTIQNTLRAFTDNTTAGSELAWIEKKLILEVNTVLPVDGVPIPPAVWLFGSAFGVLALIRRKQ